MQVLLGVPSLEGGGWLLRTSFRSDAEYFYPASAIKLCVAVGALETFTEIRASCKRKLGTDAALIMPRRGATSVETLIERALVVSDNDATNALFDLAGHAELHERMWRLGLATFRMRHRLDAPPNDDVRKTPRIVLGRSTVLPRRESKLVLDDEHDRSVAVGASHLVAGRLVDGPMSFASKNRVSLRDLQALLVGVMRPDLATIRVPRLGDGELELLRKSLGAFPSERSASAIDIEHKPIASGVERIISRRDMLVASKSGRAYGFVVDNAYVVDKRTGRSFFLAVAIYTNDNGRLNDDVYQYSDRAFPILGDIGEIVARAVFGESRMPTPASGRFAPMTMPPPSNAPRREAPADREIRTAASKTRASIGQ